MKEMKIQDEDAQLVNYFQLVIADRSDSSIQMTNNLIPYYIPMYIHVDMYMIPIMLHN